MSMLGDVVVLRGGGIRSAWRASSRMRERATVRGAWVRLWGGVGGGGCVVVAEFSVKCLHFLHADIVICTQLEFVHGGRWVEIDVVGEGAGL